MKTFLLVLTCLFAQNSFAKDCGIVPRGATYGPNCELIPTTTPQKNKSVAESKTEQIGSLTAQIGFYSGKPGYFVNIGTEFQTKLDALVMNEAVFDELSKVFATANLGQTKTCKVRGLQQGGGFSIFRVENCR